MEGHVRGDAAVSALVLDTHALIWYLQKSARLVEPARTAIKLCVDSGELLYVSPISLAEILYLQERNRLPAGTLGQVLSEMRRDDGALTEAPLLAAVVEAMLQIPAGVVPELPDRL